MSDWTGTGVLTQAPSGIPLVGAVESGVYRAHRTLLSLEEYANVMGLDALRVAGGNSGTRPSGICDDTWFEFDWQDDADKVGRWELLSEIMVAEEDIAKVLRWWPGPVWVTGEAAQFPRFSQRPEAVSWAKPLTLTTAWAKVRAVGTLTESVIDTAWVTREADIDGDGDGFAEMAHFSVVVPAGTDMSGMRAYFKEYATGDAVNCRTDPASRGADQAWEVWPLTCVSNGVTVDVYVHIWWLFRPQLRYGLAPDIINADDDNSYVDTLLFTYQAAGAPAAQLAWFNTDACCVETDAGVGATADIGAGIRDGNLGLLTLPATDLRLAGVCMGVPNALRLSYAAGAPTLTHFWAEMIAILATSRLPRPLCSCNPVSQRVQWWQEDLAYTGGEGGHQTAPATLTNPFGTRRGEDWVWKRIQRYRIPARPILG